MLADDETKCSDLRKASRPVSTSKQGNITVEDVLMDPKHPYTQLLRESIPEADPNSRWDTKVNLDQTEQEEYLRQGCKFAGRCPAVMDICH